jgi:hypothetical protein
VAVDLIIRLFARYHPDSGSEVVPRSERCAGASRHVGARQHHYSLITLCRRRTRALGPSNGENGHASRDP